MLKIFSVVMSAAIMMTSSCTSNKKSLREHEGSYLESVRLNYDAGLQALANKDFDRAIGYFKFVKIRYPDSKYAALSSLRIADTKFDQEKWSEAATSYDLFMRLHSRNPKVPYASYRVGTSYFHAIPNDFFLLPSSTSRDQSFTKEALAAIERFLVQFPGSKNADDAQKKRALLFSKLAQHHQHVARYYLKRGRHKAAQARYLEVYNLYPEIKEAADSLMAAAKIAVAHLDDKQQAIELFTKVIEQNLFPKVVQKAKSKIDKLK